MNRTSQTLRVGIADDLRIDRTLLAEMLKALGHEVVFQAQSGRELLEACRQYRPDLVVTDNLMPNLSGLEVAALIYNRWSMPVILLSASSDPASVRAAERMHVAVYLVKPLEQSHLEKAIALVLRRCAESQPNEDPGAANPEPLGRLPGRKAEPDTIRRRPAIA